MWLADQAQSSVPAWLTSPWVAVLGLVSSVIAILQVIMAVGRWFMAKTDSATTRKRLNTSLAVCMIASTVVLAPWTWQTMAVMDVMAQGNPLWLAETFPSVIFGPMVLFAYIFWKYNFDWKGQKVVSAFIVVTICLVFPPYVYYFYHTALWERCLVASTPSITFIILVATCLAHVWPRAKSATADSAKRPSVTTEKVS